MVKKRIIGSSMGQEDHLEDVREEMHEIVEQYWPHMDHDFTDSEIEWAMTLKPPKHNPWSKEPISDHGQMNWRINQIFLKRGIKSW